MSFTSPVFIPYIGQLDSTPYKYLSIHLTNIHQSILQISIIPSYKYPSFHPTSIHHSILQLSINLSICSAKYLGLVLIVLEGYLDAELVTALITYSESMTPNSDIVTTNDFIHVLINRKQLYGQGERETPSWWHDYVTVTPCPTSPSLIQEMT